MNTTDNTIPVAVFKCTYDHAWYKDLPKPMILTVRESGTPGDWRIVYGDYKGLHVAMDDCTEKLGDIGTDIAV